MTLKLKIVNCTDFLKQYHHKLLPTHIKLMCFFVVFFNFSAIAHFWSLLVSKKCVGHCFVAILKSHPVDFEGLMKGLHKDSNI